MKQPIAEIFSQGVQNNVVQASNDITVMCCQHNEERGSLEKESYFAWRFDEKRAQSVLSALNHLRPSPCESFLIWRAFGWVSKADDSRRYSSEAF